MAKKKFTRKQLAAQRLFTKRAKSGYFKRKRKGSKTKGKGKICFDTVTAVANYARKHGYKVVHK
jgi:hypothetical protein